MEVQLQLKAQEANVNKAINLKLPVLSCASFDARRSPGVFLLISVYCQLEPRVDQASGVKVFLWKNYLLLPVSLASLLSPLRSQGWAG